MLAYNDDEQRWNHLAPPVHGADPRPDDRRGARGRRPGQWKCADTTVVDGRELVAARSVSMTPASAAGPSSTRSGSTRRRTRWIRFPARGAALGAPPTAASPLALPILALLVGLSSIRDVIAFPKTASGSDRSRCAGAGRRPPAARAGAAQRSHARAGGPLSPAQRTRYESGARALRRRRPAAEIVVMAQASRPLLVFVALAFVLVAAWLLVGQPQPTPPDRSNTLLAPLQSIQPAGTHPGSPTRPTAGCRPPATRSTHPDPPPRPRRQARPAGRGGDRCAATLDRTPRLVGVPDERFEDHLTHPRGRGREVAGASHGAAGGNACGDLVRFCSPSTADGRRVSAAGFEASGCGTMLAAGSAAVALVEGTGPSTRHGSDRRRSPPGSAG